MSLKVSDPIPQHWGNWVARTSEVGRWLNNRAEGLRLPFRRRERVMQRFRRMKSLQKFASIHANVHNRLNIERQLIYRQIYKAPPLNCPG